MDSDNEKIELLREKFGQIAGLTYLDGKLKELYALSQEGLNLFREIQERTGNWDYAELGGRCANLGADIAIFYESNDVSRNTIDQYNIDLSSENNGQGWTFEDEVREFFETFFMVFHKLDDLNGEFDEWKS